MSTPSSYDAPFLRDVVTQTTECIVTIDQGGEIVFANPAVKETLGYEVEDLTGRQLDALLNDSDDSLLQTLLQAWADGDESETRQITMRHRDGRPVPVVCSSKPIEHEGHQYVTITIQETAHSEQRIYRDGDSETERLLQQLFEQSTDAVFLFDEAGRELVDCNDRACELLGDARKANVLGMGGNDIFGERAFPDLVRTVTESQKTETTELTCATADGETVAVEVSASIIELHGQRKLLAHAQPIDEQRADRETIRTRTAAIDAAIDGIATLDENGAFTYVNEAHANIYGYDDPEELVGENWRVLYGDAETLRFEKNILPKTRQSGSWRGEAIGKRKDETTFPQKLSLASLDTGGLVCVVRDISSDRDDGNAINHAWLTALNEASQELMQVQQQSTIADVTLDTVERLFDYEVACVRLLDEDENTLDIVAATDAASTLIESEPACNLEATLAGQAYRQDEPIVRSADDSDALAATPVSASVHLSLGDVGVLTVASTEAASFSEMDVEGAKMLAASVEAALNRAERERQLREQTENLEQRRDQLETVNQINKLVHDLIGDLIRASSRDVIQQQVCDRLADSRLYSSAWVGRLTVTDEGVSVEASAGIDEESIAGVDELPIEVIADGIVKEALESGEVVDNRRYRVLADSSTDPDEDSIKSIAAVPIQYADRTYGVIVVNAINEDAFRSVSAESLDILGNIVAFSINAVENRELLLSNETLQLEFEVTDPDCLAVALTQEFDGRCRIQNSVTTSGGTYLSYVELEGVSGAEAEQVMASLDDIIDYRLISGNEDRCVAEIERQECGSEVMMEYGATMQRAEAENGVGSLVIEAPKSANTREIADAYESYNPSSELVAKRELKRPVRTAAEFRESIEERLTDKQTSALTSAYYSGYYEWPRESTGEEIANSMGISSATLHQHLRSAHREFLTAFLNGNADAPAERPTL